MGSQPTTLTPADVRRFERDGYVVVRQEFSRDDGLAMERQWWRELEDAHGIRPDDRSSWRRLPGDLKAASGYRSRSAPLGGASVSRPRGFPIALASRHARVTTASRICPAAAMPSCRVAASSITWCDSSPCWRRARSRPSAGLSDCRCFGLSPVHSWVI